MGKTQEKWDFLLGSSKNLFITKKVNNVRRSCIAIFLDVLPDDLASSLRKSSHVTIYVCIYIFTVRYSVNYDMWMN